MGSASRRRAAVQRKLAAQRAAARRAEIRRMIIAGGAVTVVVAIVVTLIVVRLTSGTAVSYRIPAGAARARIVKEVTSVPPATLAAVGLGGASLSVGGAVSGPPLTARGKPELLYIGAELCPYCAAERWGMAVALSRFGRLTRLGLTYSSTSDDVAPGTRTLTFYGCRYASKYLTFTPVETYRNVAVGDSYPILQRPTRQQLQIWSRYVPDLSFPFLDCGGRYVIDKSSNYPPELLAGMSWGEIASSLANPRDRVARAIDGTANVITAAICGMTNDRPAPVCRAPSIKEVQAQL
jgi:Domain of unknown function (DUF929)